jgi:hypothetical protein
MLYRPFSRPLIRASIPGRLHPVRDRGLDLLHRLAVEAARAPHRLLQHREAQRVHRREPELLQLPAHPVHAQALRDRGVDLQRLARDAPALVRAHHPEGAHVVQPVGQLDQDHPDVLGDREHHLAEVLGLGLGLGLELQVRQLGDAIHQVGDLGPELAADALLAGRVSSITSCRMAAMMAL